MFGLIFQLEIEQNHYQGDLLYTRLHKFGLIFQLEIEQNHYQGDLLYTRLHNVWINIPVRN